MSTGKVVSGVLAGLAVGTVLGILFAPQRGSEIRSNIKDKRNDFMDKLKSKYNDLSESVKSQFESVKEDAADLAEQGKNNLKT